MKHKSNDTKQKTGEHHKMLKMQ